MLDERIQRAVRSLHQIDPAPRPIEAVMKTRRHRRVVAGGATIVAIAASVGLAFTFDTTGQPRSVRVIAPTNPTVLNIVHGPIITPTTELPPTTVSTTTTMPLSSKPGADWDVDGDGRLDSAQLAYLGPSGGPDFRLWKLTVKLTSLGQQTVDFSATQVGFKQVGIVGSVDADHDGRGDIFIEVNSGASTQTWTIFSLVNGTIKQVAFNGEPFTFLVNGSVTHTAGFSCNGSNFVTTTAQLDSGSSYNSGTVITSAYRWGNGTLTLISQTTTKTSADIFPYGRVTCGDLPDLWLGPGQ